MNTLVFVKTKNFMKRYASMLSDEDVAYGITSELRENSSNSSILCADCGEKYYFVYGTTQNPFSDVEYEIVQFQSGYYDISAAALYDLVMKSKQHILQRIDRNMKISSIDSSGEYSRLRKHAVQKDEIRPLF